MEINKDNDGFTIRVDEDPERVTGINLVVRRGERYCAIKLDNRDMLDKHIQLAKDSLIGK